MKAYTFQVELEPDGEGWHVYFPDWERRSVPLLGAILEKRHWPISRKSSK